MGRKVQGRQGLGHQGLAKTRAAIGSPSGQKHEARQVLRGFVTGGAWGLIVAMLGVTGASLLASQPPGNAPPGEPLVEMTQVEAAGDVVDPPVFDIATTDALAEPIAAPSATPALPVAVAAAETDALLADTTPASPPVIASSDASLAQPESGGLPAPALATDTPVLPNPQAPAPAIPASEADLVLSTDPAPAPVPPPPDPDPAELIAVIPVPQSAEVAAVVVAAPPGAILTEGGLPDALIAADTAQSPAASPTTTSVEPDAADPVPAPEPTAEPEVAPVAEPEPQVAPVILTEPTAVPEFAPVEQVLPPLVPESVPESVPEPVPEPVPEVAPEIAVEPAQPPVVVTLSPDLSQTAQPPTRIILQGDVGTLPQVAGGVRVNRPDSSDTLIPAVIEPEGQLGDIIPAASALTQFAAAFDNPDGKPLISVILVDDGAITGLSDTLADVPFPVTIAINPGDPDATVRMRAYRARGIEVLAIATLPQGAEPSDVEVTLEAAFASLPEAVGLIDLGNGQVQSSAAVTGQTLARLAADGRGLVVFSDGLNPALRAAATAGVPAVEVARDLDGNGQDAGTIRRFLDNAAFQARQDSGIVLLARLRPETISALILWGAENRAGQVALAPISGTLTQ